MVRQIFRFEILLFVLYVGISAHFMVGKLRLSFQARPGLAVSAATDARDIFPVTLVISQHVDTKEYERVLSFSIRCRRHVCSSCLNLFFFLFSLLKRTNQGGWVMSTSDKQRAKGTLYNNGS